jgi:preprotein translocase subunit YajC
MTENKSAFFKDFSLKDFAYLLFIVIILVAGYLLMQKNNRIKALEEQIASLKPDTVFIQGQVITDTLAVVKIKIDTLKIPINATDTVEYVKVDTIYQTPCKGTILLKDNQPLFDMRAKVGYPSGKAEFIYNYKVQPEKWQWNAGFGFYNNWKPFALSDISKGKYGIGAVLSSDRWGLYLKRKF